MEGRGDGAQRRRTNDEMTYVERVLQPGETVRYVSRIHWIVYLPGAALAALGLAGFAALRLGWSDPTGLGPAPPLVAGAILLWGAALMAGAWFRRWTTELAATDRRIIYKRGFIRRHSIEMNMDKVESVDVDQSIFGRLFDYGDITVRGTGTGIEPLRNIDSPLDFRNHVTAR